MLKMEIAWCFLLVFYMTNILVAKFILQGINLLIMKI